MAKNVKALSVESSLALEFLKELVSQKVDVYRECEESFSEMVTWYSPVSNSTTNTKIKFYSDIRQVSLERGWLIATGKNLAITVKGVADVELYIKGAYEDPPPKLEDTKFKQIERAILDHPILVWIYLLFLTFGAFISITTGVIQLLPSKERNEIPDMSFSPERGSAIKLPAPVSDIRPTILRQFK